MKKLSLGLALLASAVLLKAPAIEAATDTAAGVAVDAIIRGGITIVEAEGGVPLTATNLSFGEVIADSAAVGAGAIVISGGPAFTSNCTNGCASVVTAGKPARFIVTGAPNQNYNISAVGTLTACINGNCPLPYPTITFDFFSVNGQAALLANNIGQMDSVALGRNDDLYVEGTLNFDPINDDGEYSGTFDVTVSFP